MPFASAEHELYAPIEAALRRHPAVLEVSVQARRASDGAAMPVAYAVTTRDVSASELAALHPQLGWVRVTRLPRDPSGAIDRAALEALPVLDAALVAEAERQLRARGAADAAAWIEPAPLTPSAPEPARAVVSAPEPLVPEPAPSSLCAGGPLQLPADAPRTLVEALERTVARYPERGIVHVDYDGETFQSYAELYASARRVVSALRAADIGARQPGGPLAPRTVVLQSASTRDHVTLFWGCVLAGLRPVAVATPARYDDDAATAKLRQVLEVAGGPPIVASPALAEGLATLTGAPRVVAVDPGEWPVADDLAQPGPDDTIFLQLTSGSTSAPKSVMEASSRVIAHVYATQAMVGYAPDDVVLNWLPFDHVVPILTCHLRAVVLGNAQVLVRPQMVLAEPLVWLDLIDRHRVTDTWSPNFGFKILADALAARGEGRRWDLSCVARWMNAGELVTATAVEALLARGAPFGLRAAAMQPAFGMAELATCMTYRQGYVAQTCVRTVRRSSVGGRLEVAAPGDDDAVSFVDLGPPVRGVAIRIVGSDGAVLPEGVVGGLQVKGPVVTPGYFGNPKATREALADDGWFDTGDLGFVHRGSLTVTGRAKEIVIVRGVHYACHEIEQAVQGVPGVDPTCVAAASAHVRADGTDGLAVFFSPVDPSVDAASTAAAVKKRVAHVIGLTPHWAVAIERAAFPKTTSGKIQRIKMRTDLEAGRYRDSAPVEGAADSEPPPYVAVRWEPAAGASVRAPRPLLVLAAADDRRADGLPSAARVPLGAPAAVVSAAAPGPIDVVVLVPEVSPVRTAAELDVALAAQVDPLASALLALAGRDVGLALVVGARAQAVGEGEVAAPEQAALAAWARAASGELPFSLRHVDAGPGLALDAVVRAELAVEDVEPEVAHRGGVRMAPRLVPHAGAPAPTAPGTLTVIIGGAGEVGVRVARHLAARGGPVLVVGRRALAADHPLHALSGVQYRAADAADAAALAGAVEASLASLGVRLGAVLHLAASIDERPLAEESPAARRATVWGKAAGALSVAALLERHPAASLTVFSSITSFAGGQGVAAYAWANRFVEALTARAARERPARALAWSAWSGSASARDDRRDALRARGFVVLEPELALRALDRAPGLTAPVAAVGFDVASPHVSRRLWAPGAPASRLAAAVVGDAALLTLVDRFARPVTCTPRRVESIPRDAAGLADPQALRRALAGLAPLVAPRDDREAALARVWTEALSLDAVGVHDNLFDVGGHSVLAAQILGLINARVSPEVSLVEIYRYPTIAGLAAWIGGERPDRVVGTAPSRDALQRRRARART